MNLKDYILKTISTAKELGVYWIDFEICLNSNGEVINDSINTIKFSIQIK